MTARNYDAVVVGAGPNGLAAAIRLAQAGLSTCVFEARDRVGGGARTEALTLPGFWHDPCSAVHPLGLASPFFKTLDLERHGVRWIQPPAALAHVLGADEVVTLERSIEATAARLGPDGAAYRELVEPFVEGFEPLLERALGPLRLGSLGLARFGMYALRSLSGLAHTYFQGAQAPALLAGIAGHVMQPLEAPGTASIALVLAVAGHAVGWPLVAGGSQGLSDGLARCLVELGGQIVLDHRVTSLRELPKARAYVLDVAPDQLSYIAADALPVRYRQRLARFRYGPGVFKIDWALSGPIPWQNPECLRSSTVHLAGDLDTIARSEAAVHGGRLLEPAFTILVQPTLFDPTRAPSGQHTAWAYCHVPHASRVDATAAIERQVERYAPGFRDLVLARACKNALEMQRYNPNYVGGDINAGASDLGQLFFRPVLRLDPYTTPAPNVFVCSSSTPPGGGVHGMCGYWAAESVLRRLGVKAREVAGAHAAAH